MLDLSLKWQSFSTSSRSAANVPSVEWSSIMTSSQLEYDCFATLARKSLRYALQLRIGTTRDTSF